MLAFTSMGEPVKRSSFRRLTGAICGKKNVYDDVACNLEDENLPCRLPRPHRLAIRGNYEELEKELAKSDPLLLDAHDRTALHCAAICPNTKLALKTVDVILSHPKISAEANGIEVCRKYIDLQDTKGNTALHYAARGELVKVAERLMNAAADVNLKNKENKDPLALIYSRCPSALMSFFDRGVRIKEGYEVSDENLKLVVDFGSIIGFDTNDHDYEKFYPRETQLLIYALDRPWNSKEILTHPLVYLFLVLKWKKIRVFFFLSLIFHIFWLVLYTVFVTKVFRQGCCCYNKGFLGSSHNGSGNKTFYKFSWLGFSSIEEEDFIENRSLKCSLDWWNSLLLYSLALITGIVALKEVYEMYSTRVFISYFRGQENVGQWIIIGTVITLCWPLLLGQPVAPWMYEISAFGIFMAWCLVLMQIGKHPRLSLHVEILGKVLKSLLMFMLIFSSLLMAFALSLSLVLPENPSFATLPLSYMKVVVMMTGELDYDGIFSGEHTNTFPVSGRIIYLIFVMVVSITLLNLLIGFTVSDIQGLEKRAEVNKQSNQLEQIYLLESFILSKNMQKLLCSKRHWLKTFLVAPPNEALDLEIEINYKDIPEELRKPLRQKAAMNSGMLTLDLLKENAMDDDIRTKKLIKQVILQFLTSQQLEGTVQKSSEN